MDPRSEVLLRQAELFQGELLLAKVEEQSREMEKQSREIEYLRAQVEK